MGSSSRRQLVSRTPMPAIPKLRLTSELEPLAPFLDAVRESIEVLTGQTGFELDRAVTLRDLYESGVASVYAGGKEFAVDPTRVTVSGGGSGILPVVQTEIATAQPPVVTGLAASGALATVTLTWDEIDYPGHAYVEIWRASTDDIGVAVRIGISQGLRTVYSDAVGATGGTYYYWVRAVNEQAVPGPYNSVHGTQAVTAFVAAPDLAPASVTTAAIADAAINTQKLADLAVEAAKLASSSVTATKIANAAVGSAAIATAAVGSAHIANAAILTAHIGTAQITTATIVDGAITNAKIGSLAVDSAKLASAAVTTAKIADANITEAKIANLAVTTLKIGNQAVTIPDAAYTAGTIAPSSTFTDIQTVTHANSGDGSPWPVLIIGSFLITNDGADADNFSVRVREDDTTTLWGVAAMRVAAGDSKDKVITMMVKHTPASAGNHTYDIQVRMDDATFDAECSERSLAVIGLKK
jgi:hypothetical protein